MAERKYLGSISELPEGIVHNILFRLSSKDAFQAGASCRAWHAAWCTRPSLLFTNVDFSPENLGRNQITLSRYCSEKIGIHNLRIFTDQHELAIPKVFERWDNWIQIAVENGVKMIEYCPYIKRGNWLLLPSVVFQAESLVELHIRGCDLKLQGSENIRCYNLKRFSVLCSSFDEQVFQKVISSCPLIEILDIGGFNSSDHLKTWMPFNNGVSRIEYCPYITHEGWLLLPPIVFRAESLVELHIRGCEVKLQGDENIRCYNLKSLSLSRSTFTDQVFEKIISSCPLIEKLDIGVSNGFDNLRVSKLEKLKCLDICLFTDCSVEVQSSSLEEFHLSGTDGGATLTLHACPNLKTIILCNLAITDEFFSNFGCKFPQLDYLSFFLCNLPSRLIISSQSVKKLRMSENFDLEDAEIDVPSLETFEFEYEFDGSDTEAPQFTVKAVSAHCTYKINGTIKMVHCL